MFDSREYEWADITLLIGGRDMTGIRAVKYEEDPEMEALYAKGRFPHSIQYGNVKYAGEIVLLMSDYLALRASGGGTIRNLLANALVSYGNPTDGDAIVTDRQEGIRFGKVEMGMKQGDKFMEVTIPYLFLRLVPNV
ncbi:hypothetical protein [Flavobacterium cerinum]|uniref:Uncharacterized protein n=1 Tax=Flavobacterium cerinum TaxID=2502784 RepID=A0A444HBV1_9FLAO|nr:hypothetical protein [Flavobacterium cerinum]RWX00915.1 hypothetical protein EPI11_07795 [Flavobacterium cerinum]